MVHAMLIILIDLSVRICAIDATALRSSKYNSGAKCGKGTCFGKYKCYKMHCTASVIDIILSVSFFNYRECL